MTEKEKLQLDLICDSVFLNAMYHFCLAFSYTEENIDVQILNIHRNAAYHVISACRGGLINSTFDTPAEAADWFCSQLDKEIIADKSGNQIRLNEKDIDVLTKIFINWLRDDLLF